MGAHFLWENNLQTLQISQNEILLKTILLIFSIPEKFEIYFLGLSYEPLIRIYLI